MWDNCGIVWDSEVVNRGHSTTSLSHYRSASAASERSEAGRLHAVVGPPLLAGILLAEIRLPVLLEFASRCSKNRFE